MEELVEKKVPARFFIKMTGKKPLLLIDDVLLELDNVKRGNFLSLLTDYSQAFFTFLPDEKYFSSRKDEMLEYTVREGRVEKKS